MYLKINKIRKQWRCFLDDAVGVLWETREEEQALLAYYSI